MSGEGVKRKGGKKGEKEKKKKEKKQRKKKDEYKIPSEYRMEGRR